MPTHPISQRLEDISASMEAFANELASCALDLRNSHAPQETSSPETYLGQLRYDCLLQSLQSELSRTRAALEKAQHDAERYRRRIDYLQSKQNLQPTMRESGGSGLIDQHTLLYRRKACNCNVFL